MHTHDVKEFRSSGRVIHVHQYSTKTTIDDEHLHFVRGVTAPAVGGIDEHVHKYQGITTFDSGHVHFFSGVTGPAIPLPGGNHSHAFSGNTTFNSGHKHSYKGQTGRGF